MQFNNDAAEEVAEDALDLPVYQVRDVELVKAVGLLKLPRAWASDDDLRFVFFQDRVLNDFEKLRCV